MSSQNHVQTARDFLVASDKEFEAEDYLQASEKLWGAASHATLALAKQKGSRDNRHRALRNLIREVAESEDAPFLRAGFAVAEKFHANFYHNFLPPGEEFSESREVVHEFVDAVLSLVNSNTQAQNGQESG
jgi:uncharacterized protein (UPF0332 family)